MQTELYQVIVLFDKGSVKNWHVVNMETKRIQSSWAPHQREEAHAVAKKLNLWDRATRKAVV